MSTLKQACIALACAAAFAVALACSGKSADSEKPAEDAKATTETAAPDKNVGEIVLDARQRAYVRLALDEMRTLKAALTAYSAQEGAYPSGDWSALAALVPANIGALPQSDPWGAPYAYTSDGSTYEIRSSGPDGSMETADDVVSKP